MFVYSVRVERKDRMTSIGNLGLERAHEAEDATVAYTSS